MLIIMPKNDEVTIPEGFFELVKLILKEDPASDYEIPVSKDDIWRHMVWFVFLIKNMSNASVNYITSVVPEEILSYNYVKKISTEKWREALKEALNTELVKPYIDEEKRSIMNTVLSNMEFISDSIMDMLRYFEDEKVSKKFIESRTITEKDIENFIGEIYHNSSDKKIYGIGLVKVLLWLHDLGIANHLPTPSRHVKKFVDECIYRKEYDYKKKDDEENEGLEWQYMKEVQRFTEQSIKSDIPEATPRDVERAIYYWKSTQDILSGRKKKLLTPYTLLYFMKINKMNLGDLGKKITDIDMKNGLADELRAYLD